MKVAPTVRRIELDPSGNYLFLTDSKQDTVQIAFFDFVRDINTTGSPFKGAADAPVVIAEFSDFECFYCKRLTPILDRVLEQYPGQVKIVFKNFPLNSHENAAMAAQAALAADRQQQFWKFHDRLFDFADQLNESKIFEIAEEINLDMEQFKKDIGRPDITTKINQDIREGRQAGIRGVPTVFVNGRRLKRHSLEAFASIIEEELAKTKKGAGKSRAGSN
jgi:protein-disulfide isomerase